MRRPEVGTRLRIRRTQDDQFPTDTIVEKPASGKGSSWPTLAPSQLRLPHPSRFSAGGSCLPMVPKEPAENQKTRNGMLLDSVPLGVTT